MDIDLNKNLVCKYECALIVVNLIKYIMTSNQFFVLLSFGALININKILAKIVFNTVSLVYLYRSYTTLF